MLYVFVHVCACVCLYTGNAALKNDVSLLRFARLSDVRDKGLSMSM